MLGLEVLTPAEMGEADRRAARLIPSRALMENAGRFVARTVAARMRPCRVLVACGPGNNGGDGYVAARLLARRGWPVAVTRLDAAPADPEGGATRVSAPLTSRGGDVPRVRFGAGLSLPAAGSDAAIAASLWRGPVVPFTPAEAARADLVIDALFGAGANRPIPPDAVALLRAARRVIAVDVPSGLDGATGAPFGDVRAAEVRAAEATVTFVRPKPAHLLEAGRGFCGEVVVGEIGMPPAVLAGMDIRTFRNAPGLWRLRDPGAADQKYVRGVVCVCGGATMSGAARLAAHAARRAGAGLVRIGALDGGGLYRAAAEPGLIIDDGTPEEWLRDEKRRVWVCGPGLTAAEAERCLGPLLAARGRMVVVDAGALTLAAGDPARLRGAAVLTPHEGEFHRVFGGTGADRLAAVRRAAVETGAVVVLKGAATVIASPDGRAAINDHATAALATAGTGDTLAGVVAAMLAAGLAPFEAAAAGVWLHGDAGIRAGDGLIAEDVAEALPAALRAARRLMTLQG